MASPGVSLFSPNIPAPGPAYKCSQLSRWWKSLALVVSHLIVLSLGTASPWPVCVVGRFARVLGGSFIAVRVLSTVGGCASFCLGVSPPTSRLCWACEPPSVPLLCILTSGSVRGGLEARGPDSRVCVCISSCHLDTDAGCEVVFGCCSS